MSPRDTIPNIQACRICLCTDLTDSVNFAQDNHLLQLFEYCVGLKVTSNDVPKVICNNCVTSMRNYAQFKDKCIKSDSLWRSITTVDDQCYSETTLGIASHNVKIEEISTSIEINIEKDQLEKNTHVDFKSVTFGTQIDTDDLKGDEEYDTIRLNAECSIDIKTETQEDIKVDQSTVTDNNDSINVGDDELVCSKCNKKYVKKACLTKHLKFCRIQDEKDLFTSKKKYTCDTYYCGICEVVSYDKETLNRHLAKHYTDNDLDCRLCKYRAHDLAAIMRHRYSHYPSDIRTRMACHLCDKKTQSSMSLEFHYRSAHLGMPGGLCLQCDKKFTVFKSWKNHKLGHRTCNLICDHCGKKYLFKHQIIEHIKDAHSNVKNYICDECGKGFKRMYSLQSHKSSVHYKLGPLNCSHCGKLFKTPTTLMEHMKYVGTPNKSYRCEVCDKRFASPYRLRLHSIWHSGEKPHCCDVCGSRYKAKGHLKIHLRTHTGERPYQCKLCMEAYMTVKLLKRHQRVHTGDTKPFKCELCEKGFTTNGSLLRHCKVRHKDIDDVKAEDVTVLN